MMRECAAWGWQNFEEEYQAIMTKALRRLIGLINNIFNRLTWKRRTRGISALTKAAL